MANIRSGGFLLDEATGALITSNGGVGASVPAGANTVGNVGLAPRSSGGLSNFRLISAATTNATVVKASPGQVYGWYLFNANAAVRYLKVYNRATAPTVGTDVPVAVLPLPAGQAANCEIANGVFMSAGIAFALTTGVDDTDTGAVAAREIVVNIMYV